MGSILQTLSQDHRHCDGIFAEAENACANGDWDLAKALCNELLQAMEHHFRMEEQVLFPAFEEATGALQGRDCSNNPSAFPPSLEVRGGRAAGGGEPEAAMAMGPTQAMRSEHAQMRELFEEMAESVQAHRQDQYLGLSETLLMIMQQHNAKEEQVLYRMSDRLLAEQVDGLLQCMAAVG